MTGPWPGDTAALLRGHLSEPPDRRTVLNVREAWPKIAAETDEERALMAEWWRRFGEARPHISRIGPAGGC